jgi:hypothetical protein
MNRSHRYFSAGSVPKKVNEVYIVWDFETFAPGEWFAVAVCIAEYPSRKILMEYKVSIPLPLKNFHPDFRKFWEALAPLKLQLDQESRTHVSPSFQYVDYGFEISKKRRELCQFMRQAHVRYPRLRTISDNPGVDLAILDRMLAQENLPAMSVRHNGKSAPVLDTRSYKLGVMGVINGKAKDTVETVHRALFPHAHANLTLDYLAGLEKHIPRHDCARILSHHFKILDIAEFYRSQNFHPHQFTTTEHCQQRPVREDQCEKSQQDSVEK